jgi:hypothetical protein
MSTLAKHTGCFFNWIWLILLTIVSKQRPYLTSILSLKAMKYQFPVVFLQIVLDGFRINNIFFATFTELPLLYPC